MNTLVILQQNDSVIGVFDNAKDLIRDLSALVSLYSAQDYRQIMYFRLSARRVNESDELSRILLSYCNGEVHCCGKLFKYSEIEEFFEKYMKGENNEN